MNDAALQFKLSKKVAELTLVVHMLFTRNHEREVCVCELGCHSNRIVDWTKTWMCDSEQKYVGEIKILTYNLSYMIEFSCKSFKPMVILLSNSELPFKISVQI